MHYRPDILVDDRTSQEARLATIAHEISHQWWGHRVGWDSYRDQWLSEALADVSSVRFMSKISQKPDTYLLKHSRVWRTALKSEAMDGRRIGSLGPAVLGWRLRWNHGGGTYHQIVYQRGAAAFSTLAQRLGPEQMWQMLGSLSKAVNNRDISTSTFFKALERMSGQDLSGFTDQYVYGSGMPAMFYDYRILPAQEGWLVEGQVRQLPAAQFRYVLKRAGKGWDVVRVAAAEPDTSSWVNTVPFYYEITPPTASSTRSAVQGSLTVQGELSSFSIPVTDQPANFKFDPRGQILAEWFSEEFQPRRQGLRLGEHLGRIGRFEEALSVLSRAQTEPLDVATEAASLTPEQEARARELNAGISLARARIYLDLGDGVSAKKELRAAERLIPEGDDFRQGDRTILAVRLDTRSGRFDIAHDRLGEYLHDYGLELGSVNPTTLLDQSGVGSIQISRGEMLALIAAVARERGDRDASLIGRAAVLSGVDMRAFTTR
jgi:hypothetical protein